jgi:hypothetical protein
MGIALAFSPFRWCTSGKIDFTLHGCKESLMWCAYLRSRKGPLWTLAYALAAPRKTLTYVWIGSECHSERPVQRIASRHHLDNWDGQRPNMSHLIKCTPQKLLVKLRVRMSPLYAYRELAILGKSRRSVNQKPLLRAGTRVNFSDKYPATFGVKCPLSRFQ